jgi:hypothetical protein
MGYQASIGDVRTLAEAYCKTQGVFGLYLSVSMDSTYDEYRQAAPYLANDPVLWIQFQLKGWVLLTFKFEKECDAYYRQTVGDDGPTKTNSYNGPARVYACKIKPYSGITAENT